jgi:hypothetical protein
VEAASSAAIRKVLIITPMPSILIESSTTVPLTKRAKSFRRPEGRLLRGGSFCKPRI